MATELELGSFPPDNADPNPNPNPNPNPTLPDHNAAPEKDPRPAPAQNPPPDPNLAPAPTSDEIFQSRFLMPLYLRRAMASAIASKSLDPPDGVERPEAPPLRSPHPLLVFINARSGGRKGLALQSVLNDLLSPEQVYNLSSNPPKDVLRYGLGFLEKLAENGDECARETRNSLRIIVAGGDGTVGWVLGCMKELHEDHRLPIPPVGTLPLGTGNDLARSFGWGGSFWLTWKPIVRRYLYKAGGDEISELDSWQVKVKTTSVAEVLPHALHPLKGRPLKDNENDENGLDVGPTTFEGIFYNYFSIGMDAQIAYGFHNLRERAPQITLGPISNKLVYSGCTCVQGWFCTPCSANPRVRALWNVMRLEVKRSPSGDWEQLELPPNVRSIVLLNLQSYASGRNPWGHPDDEYNKRKGFILPKSDDGLLEIFGLIDGWHASLVMLSLRSAKRLAQVSAIRMQLVADQRHRVYMQMDGEPWRQPITEEENSTVIEITKVPTSSLMLRAHSN